MSKCETCMQSIPESSRQLQGCPFAPAPAADLAQYVRGWAGLGYKGDAPTVCPGYTTTLPEVIEGARARLHWSKGELASFTGGEPVTEALIVAIEICEGAIADVIEWKSTPKDKGGGAG